MVADIEDLEEMDASEINARRLNAIEVLTPMKGDNFVFPVADSGIVLNEERNKKFFEENQTNSLLQLHFKRTLQWTTQKLRKISGLLQEISCLAIMWNTGANCTCRERNHFQFQ